MKKFLACMVLLTVLMSGFVFAGGAKEDGVTIAMLPKFKGENYFDAVKLGAEEAVAEYNANGVSMKLLYDGPPQDQATNQKQVDILEGWIAQKVDAILVSPNDPTAIAPTLKKAMDKGIKVATFDADAQADARDLFVNQATAEDIALGLVKGLDAQLSSQGYGAGKTANLGMISSAKTDANQQAWMIAVKDLLKLPEYNYIVIANEETDVYYPGPSETKCQSDASTLIGRMGAEADKIQAAIGLTSMAGPAIGAAYAAAPEKPDPAKLAMVGVATPNGMKSYILDEANPLRAGVLWNCMDLGYLSIQTAYQLVTEEVSSASTSIDAGRVGEKEIIDRTVLLGPALIFDIENVNQFNY